MCLRIPDLGYILDEVVSAWVRQTLKDRSIPLYALVMIKGQVIGKVIIHSSTKHLPWSGLQCNLYPCQSQTHPSISPLSESALSRFVSQHECASWLL